MKERLAELQAVCRHEPEPVWSGGTPIELKHDMTSSKWYDKPDTDTTDMGSSKWYDNPDTNCTDMTKSQPDRGALFHSAYVETVRTFKHTLKPNRKSRLNRRATEDRLVTELKEQTSIINRLIFEIKKNTKELKLLHTSALMATSTSPDDKKKMAELVVETRTAAAQAAKRITALERDDPKETTQRRIHSTQLFHVRQLFATAMERHEAELQRYAKGLRTLVAKQVAIAKGESYDTAEVEALVDEGKLNIFVDNYQEQEQEAKAMLLQATQRFHELTDIEKSIREVHDLFVDMAVLVAAQGDVIDSIEAHVLAASYETSEGRTQLKKAKGKQRSGRKKKMILAGIGAVALGLVATVAIL